MREAIIEYKDGTRKTVQIQGTLEVPEIVYTNNIKQITIIGRQGQYALFIVSEHLK